MTKPREKTREELQAEIEDGKKKGPVKIYAQNYLQARLSEVNRQ